MGGACSSSLAQSTASCSTESQHRPRRHRFTSVVNKTELRQESQQSHPPRCRVWKREPLSQQHEQEQEQTCTTPQSPLMDPAVAGMMMSPVGSITGYRAMPPSDHDALIGIVEAEQMRSMSNLAGPILESKATNATESVAPSTTPSGTASTILGSYVVSDEEFRLPHAPLPAWGPVNGVTSLPTSMKNANSGSNNDSSNIEDNSNNNNDIRWEVSLTSVPTPSLPSLVASPCSSAAKRGERFIANWNGRLSSIWQTTSYHFFFLVLLPVHFPYVFPHNKAEKSQESRCAPPLFDVLIDVFLKLLE